MGREYSAHHSVLQASDYQEKVLGANNHTTNYFTLNNFCTFKTLKDLHNVLGNEHPYHLSGQKRLVKLGSFY